MCHTTGQGTPPNQPRPSLVRMRCTQEWNGPASASADAMASARELPHPQSPKSCGSPQYHTDPTTGCCATAWQSHNRRQYRQRIASEHADAAPCAESMAVQAMEDPRNGPPW
eukprot:2377144-Rhodomonas_salina.3